MGRDQVLFFGVHPINRNQRQAQGIEPAQQALQSNLVNDNAGQGGNGWAITLAFNRNGHPFGPLRPTLVEVSGYFDLVGRLPLSTRSKRESRPHPM
jgi:hypothetical protein